MKRRHFSAQLAAIAGAAAPLCAALSTAFGVVQPAAAQGVQPGEGIDFLKLRQPVPAPHDRIEVIEFFWYGCPHCYAFEPLIEPWSQKLPADVSFRRVPIAFRQRPFVAHQRIYYALETLGQLEATHAKVFNAIHSEHRSLDEPEEIAAFMGNNGVDAKKFREAFDSFNVVTKARQAATLADAYKVDAVPAIGVQGRFFVSSNLTGTHERTLMVTDYLIKRVRKES